MIANNKLKITMVAVLAVLVSCSDSDRANKIVDAAKRKYGEADSLYHKTKERSKEMLSPKGKTEEELRA